MTAIVAVRPPWHRRLFGRQRAFAAGERPGRMGQRARGSGLARRLFLLLLALALAGAVASYFAVPQVRDRVDSLVTDARRMYDTFRHPGANAVDGNGGTYWLADPRGGPPSLTVNLTRTSDLGVITFHIGAGDGELFNRYRRPRLIEFRAPGNATRTIRLDDTPASQKRELPFTSVRTIELRILEFHDRGAGDEVLVALREVEF